MSDTARRLGGGCFCGRVQFEIEAPFIAYRYCFCSRCRKIRGTIHAANIFVEPKQFSWLAGEEHVKRFDLEGARFGNCFCGKCGSPVPRASSDGKAYLIPAGSLDEDPGTLPEFAIFWDSRADWLPTADQLEKHAEY